MLKNDELSGKFRNFTEKKNTNETNHFKNKLTIDRNFTEGDHFHKQVYIFTDATNLNISNIVGKVLK